MFVIRLTIPGWHDRFEGSIQLDNHSYGYPYSYQTMIKLPIQRIKWHEFEFIT
jgi:hypothetical protein